MSWQSFAAEAAKLMHRFPPKMLTVQFDKNIKDFYSTYTGLNPEVQKIPHTEQHKRKRIMNNITGRAGKLKKGYAIHVLLFLVNFIIADIGVAADEFIKVTRQLIDAGTVPFGLQATVCAVGHKIVVFRLRLAEWHANGTSIHDIIKESAEKEGMRASQRKVEEKLAQAAASPAPNDRTLTIDPAPPKPIDIFRSTSAKDFTIATTGNDQAQLSSPFTPDVSIPELSLYPEDVCSSLELPPSTEPFTPEFFSSDFQLPPTIAQIALNNSTATSMTPVTPVTQATPATPQLELSDSMTTSENINSIASKTVKRSIKNNATATRTNPRGGHCRIIPE